MYMEYMRQEDAKKERYELKIKKEADKKDTINEISAQEKSLHEN